ncbi:MAG: 8-oxo-dGTP diphosphatase MutT [Spongiibacteraceae bacterium]|jgi:8-oxo-dGTP diphosphatase|nr:8-oxo-dGTP diphosphatase MutT [Spongiibacteraceae bacterium]
MNDELHVAVGVVIDEHRRILIARRAAHLHQGNLWEFPGGKVEPGETVQQALVRELEEELDIRVGDAAPLLTVRHDYGDRRVLLDVWWTGRFEGQPRGLQGQEWRWVAPAELDSFEFPAANVPILNAVKQLLVAGESLSATS